MRKDSQLLSQEEFDPIEYIEQAFVEDPNGVQATETDEPELPSIHEFLLNTAATREERTANAKRARRARGPLAPETTEKMSAPRPRRRKSIEAVEPDPEIQAIWQMLPKNIAFLSSFFDDTVTANYYRGEFKESREELIQRILDPELNLEEVSRLLGVCPATVRRYTNKGWLEHHRTKGGQRRFRLSGLVKFVDEHGRGGESA